ncbi:peroxiredoxin [Nocardia huaxiensis]|uniref:thioredoxin-dependent peroxiredoxin n=1 Tax=Nocardia huaxiensis TaxID=2755382 RepID=A0A7D6VN84_9NOCA|nr:peroxiredoxin [Nocardia huaxiensis]QLY33736.1 peroxiredoxin [Nocardia huaxiensis]UFS99339.1 peroxiredoxin [Nocardia huaxiensis]
MKPGQIAPNFELADQTGTKRTLDSLLADGPVVLFFYPAANTPVCTAEACHFRDLASEFKALGASCVGISADSVDTQSGFAEKQGLNYPVLSDPGAKVAAEFGVKRGLLGAIVPVKRTTFVIDPDRTVAKVISSEMRAAVHADDALEFLKNRG